MDDYLTAREVAAYLKLSLQTIRRYTMIKKIPFHKIDRAVRFKKKEIVEWVENGMTNKKSLSSSASENEQGLFAKDGGAEND